MFIKPEEVKERVATVWILNGDFAIPPQDPDYRVDSAVEFANAAKIVFLNPHMHLRGKDFRYTAIYTTGESQILLDVPHYTFHWQTGYIPAQDIVVPKGTKIQCVADFDNSPNNPLNPDPSKEIKWGDQSWDEMMIGFAEVAMDKNLDLEKLAATERRAGKNI